MNGKMDQAWLESLSEDWLSDVPNVSTNKTTSMTSSSRRNSSSRIPIPSSRKSSGVQKDRAQPLGERSPSNNNIGSIRRHSTLQKDLGRGRKLSRPSTAESTTSSIEHNTIQKKSLSSSPAKDRRAQATPEWKRRLIHGDVGYGEKCDLFSPTGLEKLFSRPPPLEPSSKENTMPANESVIDFPSSPPSCLQTRLAMQKNRERAGKDATWETLEEEEDSEAIVDTAEESVVETAKLQAANCRKGPKAISYKLVDALNSQEFSENDLSQGSNFRLDKALQMSAQGRNPGALDGGLRAVSNGSQGRERSNSLPGRIVSGGSNQSNTTRDEGITPIYLNTFRGTTGHFEFDLAVSSPINPEELKNRLAAFDTTSQNRLSEEPSQLLPGETRDTTEDFAHNGKYVNVGRGGRSNEGSFRRRPLSPSSLLPIDEMRSSREVSPHATPRIPKIRMTQPSSVQEGDEASEFSPIPQASSSPKTRVEGIKMGSATSQLKIFGSHDTFTSKKLLRRLSQFEETRQENGELVDDDFTMTSPKPGGNDTEPDGSPSPEELDASGKTTSPKKKPRRISNFGEGELDDYDFSEDEEDANSWRRQISGYKWNDRLEENEKKVVAVLQKRPGQKKPKARKQKPEETGSSSRPGTSSSADSKSSDQKEILDTPRKPKNGDAEGKRLRISPYKDPTPKRRRTLFPATASDLSEADDEKKQLQPTSSRKRKDARNQDDQVSADPNVIASRQILMPRNASRGNSSADPNSRPTSKSSELSDDQLQELEEQTKKLAQIHADMTAHMRPPPKAFAHLQHLQGSRKASITTQDYLDDAKKIMAAIREKARPRSAMTSRDSESDQPPGPTEFYPEDYEDTEDESTPEAFERPPSREGYRPVSRMPHKQEDPEILEHLKKYAETEVDDVVASSMKQLHLARAASKTAKDAERAASATISRIAATRVSVMQNVIESDMPNIAIFESPGLGRKRKHEASETNTAEDPDNLIRSQGSSGSGASTHPSVASRGSERRNIAPEKITHLIPDELAGMVFDRQRNVWVKHKTSVNSGKESHRMPSEDTDEDPFGDIPDLSVDEAQEMLANVAAARKREQLRSDPMPAVEEVSEIQDFEAEHADDELEEISAEQFSKTQNGRIASVEASARVMYSETPQRELGAEEESFLTNPYQSPEQHPSNDVEQTPKPTPWQNNQGTFQRVTGMIAKLKAQAAQVSGSAPEKENLTFGNGNSKLSPKAPRNVTIQFSSPIASVIRDVAFDTSLNSEWDDSQIIQDSMINRSRNSTPSLPRPGSLRKSSLKVRSAFQPLPHGILPSENNIFQLRQVSTINEQDEDSVVRRLSDKTTQRSLSVVNQPSPTVSPPPISNQLQVSKQSTPVNDHQVDLGYDISLNLSPLSEFTIHRPEHSLALDVSYVGQRRHHEPSTKSRTLSVTVNQLVEKLTDLEPYEPYWEQMKQLELRNKSISSLHMLDEFCGAVVELDVSNNKIDQLGGVPENVRHFKIAHNALSDLTSWGHLINLQYVDVSNNDLTSLRGFKHLVHLRSLRADNNSITSLDGVTNLDSLLSLRLRGNQLETVDFMDTSLKRLTDLDLKGNGLTNIYNVHDLPSLVVLNLEENELEIFSSPPQEMFFSLKYLKLSGNRISRINVSRYPNLRLLYLDRNCLGKVTGLFKTKYLDSLSMREQQDGCVLDMSFLHEVYEIRKLFLSGNLLTSFAPRVDFLNLQLLELANCGLQSLPSKFGQMMSNLRVLNLNFNALRDLTPLIGIIRLKKLHLAGNRFSKLRTTASTLSHFSGLSKLDIRNNPVTQGFYPTELSKRLIEEAADGGGEEEGEIDIMDKEPFTLGIADKNLDDRYKTRLDLETRLLRRVYEMWMVDGCGRLRVLDGLEVDRLDVLGRKDEDWRALVRAGVLREKKDEEDVVESEDDGGDDDEEDHHEGETNGTDHNEIPTHDCDTPRPSIEQDDTTSSSSCSIPLPPNPNPNPNNDEWEDEVDDEIVEPEKGSSIWGAEDSFA